MPASSTATHRGRTITFTEADHRYTDDRGELYKSVSTLVHEYAQPFDAKSTAARMESQGRGDATALIESWDATRDEACEYGTRVHETAEAALRNDPPPRKPRDEKERRAFQAVWKFCKEQILTRLQVLSIEQILFNPRYYICGTADLLCRRPDGSLLILDWKTNREIKREGFKGVMMRDPVSHLPDCNLSHYSLQLNIYRQLIYSNRYTPRTMPINMMLLYINPETFEVEKIPVPDMSAEALALILDDVTNVPF